MIRFLPLVSLMDRSRRMNTYRRVRAEVECMTEAELDDMGAKRSQLGTIARKLALR